MYLIKGWSPKYTMNSYNAAAAEQTQWKGKGLKNTNVELDSEVVTTGMSYIYPAGIYIGKVIAVTYDEYGLTPIVKIKTPVDFNNILYVSVLNRW